jgi:uncharacterized phage protein (TIGR02218 family)
MLQFRGSLGEIERSGAEFRAELRGLAQALNQPLGLVYQGPCSAVVGDERCKVNLESPGMAMEVGVIEVVNARTVRVIPTESFAERWFERGQLTVLIGSRSVAGKSSSGRRCARACGRAIQSASRRDATSGPRPADGNSTTSLTSVAFLIFLARTGRWPIQRGPA